MSHTKGKCERAKNVIMIGGKYIARTIVNKELTPKEEAEANAHRFVKCWNSHDALLDACKLYQERIELFRKMNPDIIIKLGSGLGLTQAEEKGKAVIATAEKDKAKDC